MLFLSSIWSALFPILSNASFISFIEFFSSRISVWFFFRVSISLVKYSFCSLIFFLSAFNCLYEFSCSSLIFFMTVILNSLSVRSQYSMILSLVSGELSFSFCVAVSPRFFVVLHKLFLCQGMWGSKQLSAWFWAASYYIWESALSTLHCLWQGRRPVPSWSLLVPLESLVSCCCLCC